MFAVYWFGNAWRRAMVAAWEPPLQYPARNGRQVVHNVDGVHIKSPGPLRRRAGA